MKMKNAFFRFLKVYLFSWLLSFVLYFVIASYNEIKLFRIITSFAEFSISKTGLLVIHIITFIVFFIFYSAIYFIKVYRKKGLKSAITQFFLKLVSPILFIGFGIAFILTKNNAENYHYKWNHQIENTSNSPTNRFASDGKIRGMSVYGIGNNRNINLAELTKSNVEWIAAIPYFYQKDENSNNITTPKEIGIWSKRDSTFIKDISNLHEKGYHIMLKPHLWMSSGWRSNISFEDKNDWNSWFVDYRKNMIHFAKLAQKTNVHLFCIGTELRSSLQQNPEKWLALIKEIKTVYKGKLTYAANWDDDLNFSDFWKEMDYIGIQAYYPLTKNSSPNLKEIKDGWNIHIDKLKSISKKHNKQILFTEVGYRNDNFATQNPWEWGNFLQRFYRKKSDKTQMLAYIALYEKLWNKDWFAGTFPWEWKSSDFPIYKKPSQNIIAIWYQK